MSRSYSSSSNSGQQIPMFRNGSSGSSQGETKNRTEKVHNNNNNNIVAAPLKSSGDDDHHPYPDEKFEEFINRVRDETRRIGTTTTTTTTTTNKNTNTNNPDEKFEEFINRVRDEARRIGTTTTTTTNTSTSTTKPVVTGLPLSRAWRSVPNNPKNNNNNNNNARISKPVSGGTAVELLRKEAMNKKKPSVNYNGKEKEKLFSENIIDSREATKRYGKMLSPTMKTMDDEEEEYEVYYQGAIITSKEALKKYNGAFVP